MSGRSTVIRIVAVLAVAAAVFVPVVGLPLSAAAVPTAAAPVAECNAVDNLSPVGSPPFSSFSAGDSHRVAGVTSAGGSCFKTLQDAYLFVFLTNAIPDYRYAVTALAKGGWYFQPAIDNLRLVQGIHYLWPDLAQAESISAAGIAAHPDRSDVESAFYRTPHRVGAYHDEALQLILTPQDLAHGKIVLEILVPKTWGPPELPTTGATGFNRKGFISSLKSIANAIPSAKQAATAAGGVVVLSLVIGYPAFLLNKVIEGRFESWREWVRRRWKALAPQRTKLAARLKLPARAGTHSGEKWTLPRWALWPAFTLAGILGSIDDPDFGFTLTTLRTIVTLTISIAVFNFAAWTLTKRVLRRYEPNVRADIDVKLASIGILLVSVILSRLLDFSPGVVFGTVAGLVYAIELGLSRKVVVILTGTGFSAAIAIIAWVAYSLFGLIPGSATNGWLIGITEVFGGITIAGVSAAPLALLPLANLDGASLFRWRRLVWAGTYVVVLFLFVVTMFSLPQSFTAVSGDVIRWLILFGAFAVVAVGAWLVDGWLARRSAAAVPAAPASSSAARK